MDPVTICNMALGLFGAHKITSIAEDSLDSDEAEQCFIFFEPSLRAVLEEGSPLFATGFFDLGARQDSPYMASGSSALSTGTGIMGGSTLQSVRPLTAQFSFAAPNDVDGNPVVLLKPLTCDDGSGTFSILWERNGDFIICEDTDKLFCKAIKLLTDPNKWTPGYVWAVAYRLASVIAGPLTHSASIQKEMRDEYREALKEAKIMDGAQGSVIQQYKAGSTSLANRRF